MAPRTSWKGFLKLSLISIPVKAYTANETAESIRLNQLHKDCHQRVKYKKVCPEHGELQTKDIVSGYEFSPDEYVVIDTAEIAKLRPEGDKSIKIHGFLASDGLDAIYQAGKTYYLLPDGVAGDKPYALLHKGMVDRGVVALANVLISGKEQLVLVRPFGDLIALAVLHVHARIKDPGQFEDTLVDLEVAAEEVGLVETLIEASTLRDFDYAAYKDQYADRLRDLVRMKVEGAEVVQVPDAEEPKILDLMDALKKSVAEAQAAGGTTSGKSATAGKRVAASKPARKKAAKKAAKKATKKKAAKGTKKASSTRAASKKAPAKRRKSG